MAAILYLGYHGNGRNFEFVQPPKAATYYGGYSYKVDHNMAPKPWISIPNIKIYLETKFAQIGGFLYFGGHFGFKMAAIANQLWISIRNIIIYLETKSPKLEDFCIWRPFCTLVTMATAAILNFFQPPKAATHYSGYSYKFS